MTRVVMGYVLVLVAGLNLLHGVPAMFGSGHALLQRSVPRLVDRLVPGTEGVYALAFGALAVLTGLVRLLGSWALLGRERIDRELYLLVCVTFVVEMARDAKLAGLGVLEGSTESFSIVIAAALLAWLAVGAKWYTR